MSQNEAGMYAGLLMADMGAEVIKIEPLNGDPLRKNDRYRLYNRSKKSISLDLSNAKDSTTFDELVKSSDVFIQTFLIKEATSAFLDFDTISSKNSSLIYCSIPPYGDEGPLCNIPGDEGTIASYTGIYEGQGGETDNPSFVQLPLVSYGTAFTASLAIAGGLYERTLSGKGQKVEVPLYAGSVAMQATGLIVGDEIPNLTINANRPKGGLPVYRLYQCSDSWIFVACGNNVFWNKFCIALDVIHLLEDSRFAGAPWNIPIEYWEPLSNILEPIFRSKKSDYWLELLRAHDIPCAPIEDRKSFSTHPQVIHNKMLVEVDDPVLGKTTQPAPPIIFSKSPSRIQSPAPQLGQHNRCKFEKFAQPKSLNVNMNHPLEGVKIIDLTGYIAGAYGTTLLADLGAEVIKVESFAGDGFRQNSAAFQGWNQGKQGIILNLKSKEGMNIFHQLIKNCDVVTENYRAGIAKKLEVDYESLSKVNPKIIYSTVNGYGLTGPFSEYPTFDPLIQAQSGAMKDQGGEGDPVFLRIAASDYSSAILSAYAVTGALFHRANTGKGQKIEVPLINSAFAYQFEEYFSHPEKKCKPRLSKLGTSAGYRLYEASDGWFFLSCENTTDWNKLYKTLEEYEIKEHVKEDKTLLTEHLERVFSSHPVSYWIQILQSVNIKCAPSQSIRQIHKDPQASHNGLTTEITSFNLGKIKLQGLPFKFSRTSGKLGVPAPDHGEHTDMVLAKLGYTGDQISELKRNRIVG